MTAKKPRKPSVVLGLVFDRGRLEGAVVRKSGANLQVLRSFQAPLTLDPLTNDPELVGREIRNQLNSAGIREKRCVAALPLGWVLTLQTSVPEIPEEDVAAFLDVQAERGFPHDAEELMIAQSLVKTGGGTRQATLLAVPRNQAARLDTVLRAAQLKPLQFTLAVAALQNPAETGTREPGVLALAVGEQSVDLQISTGGGVVALRSLEGLVEVVEGQKHIQADAVARELKITLGQLPDGLRGAIQTLRIFGQSEAASRLARDLRPRAEALGLRIESVTAYGSGELGANIGADSKISASLSVAGRFLTGAGPEFDFLPPKVSSWPKFAEKFGSGRLTLAAAAAAVVLLGLIAAFVVQGARLSRLESRWKEMRPRVERLNTLQSKIRLFRPWHEDTARSLAVLRRVTELFPETGSVSVRSIEIRRGSEVICTGISKSATALSDVRKKMAEAPELGELQTEMRGSTFTFNFRWQEGRREN